MTRIRLIHWKLEEASTQIERLRLAGYMVEADHLTPNLLRDLRADPPDVFLVDLTRLPSQGRDLAVNLRKTVATRAIPIVFVGGEQQKVEKVRELLPDAAYSRWDDVLVAIPRAINDPPQDPLIPGSTMAGYSGTPLPKKLGIRAGSKVALLDAPQDFIARLEKLPADVQFFHAPNQECDVTLWFTLSLEHIRIGLPELAGIAGKGKFWILWPKKGSSMQTDLTQAVVRKAGLDAGLVDYKIAAIDRTWSGLCFTTRKDKS